MAKTFLFSFPSGLGSGYVSRVCHSPDHQCTLGEDTQSILLMVKPTNPIMVDQCTSLLKAAFQLPIYMYINHEQENKEVKEDVVAGKYRFMYILPESRAKISGYATDTTIPEAFSGDYSHSGISW